MAKILVCEPTHESGLRLLRRAGHSVDIRLNLTPEQLREVVQRYDAVMVRGKTRLTSEIIQNMAKTKVIARAGVGLDNIDVEAAARRGIKVVNAPEAASNSVAELTVGLMICLVRQIPRADSALKRGEWLKGELEGIQLHGKTLGIVGTGRIGGVVARTAKALGMKVVAYDKVRYEELDGILEWVQLDELLAISNLITLHTPLTEETRHMIGEREFGLMRLGAYLINTARGELVEEEALYRALVGGRLAGAALDVFQVEPPINLKLLQLPNVVCTPHIGAQTVEAQEAASLIVAEKILKELGGGEGFSH